MIVLLSYWVGLVWPATTQVTNLVIALVSLVCGILVFVAHGSRRITALGLFSFACALIIGFGGFQVALDPYRLQTPTPQMHLAIALAASTSCQILVAFTASLVVPETIEPGRHLAPRDARGLIFAGTGGILILLVLGPNIASLRLFREGMSFSFALFVSVGIILSPSRIRILWRLFAAALPVLVFVFFFHDGTGRLRVVALGCAILIAVALHYQRKWIKWLVVAGTPLAMWLMSTSRIALERQFSGATEEAGDGLSSMLASTGIFADLIYAQEQGLPLGLGTSFLTPFFVPLPEAWRPDWLPEALGYELVKIAPRELVGPGFSTVASVFGEWWWNFSFVGIILAIPFVALLLVLLDRTCIRTFVKATESSATSVVWLIFWLTMVGSLGDLVWSGIHTWLARMYARVIPLFLVAVLLPLRPEVHSRSPAANPRIHDEVSKTRVGN